MVLSGGTALRPLPRRAAGSSIEIAACPDVVFDYVTDIRNEPEWNPQMSHVEKLTPGQIGRGTRFRVRFGRGVGEAVIEDTGFDRPRSWSAVSQSRVLDVEAAGQVADVPGGCRLTIRTRLHPRGPLCVATPLLGWWMHRTWDRDLRAVKALVEGGHVSRGRP